MVNGKKKSFYISQGALTAALYVVFSLVSAAFGLSNGVIQVRISEAMSVLPYFSVSTVPGLVLGCCITNVICGGNIFDVVFGSLATLIGAIGTYLFRKKTPLLAPVPPIVANTLIIPFVLKYAYGFGDSFFFMFFTVFTGEIISSGLLGLTLLKKLKKHEAVIFKNSLYSNK